MKIFQYKKTLIVSVLLLSSAVGVYFWRVSSNSAPLYREQTVTRGDIEVSILATGVVQPRNRLEIKPPIPGRVDEMLVKEGQNVRKGDVIAWMSSSERAALLDAARAKGPDELKRWEELYRATPVIAPLDGTIILRSAEPGQTFLSTESILVMSDRLVVRASVDETDIAKVSVKQRSRITLDAYPDDVTPGSVEQIAFDAKTVNNVTTYQVDVAPARIPSFMRSGMTANVVFILSEKKNVLLLPNEAILTIHGKSQVLVPNGEANTGAPAERVVELGLSDVQHTEVLTGLKEADIVLIPQLSRKSDKSGASPFVPQRGKR